MKTVTICSSKGGVGKTTIATNLAVAAAADMRRVVLVDTDVQGSAIEFSARRESIDVPVIQITVPTAHKIIKSMFEDTMDLVIIDTGGRDSPTFRSAVIAADLVIIPILPSEYDIWAAEETIKIFREISVVTGCSAKILINQVIEGTKMKKIAEEALQMFKGIEILHNKLGQREAFKRAVTDGKGVIEFEPKGKAAVEVSAVYAEIIDLLGFEDVL